MGPHFMRLLSIYVLNLNVIYIYLVSCLVEIKLVYFFLRVNFITDNEIRKAHTVVRS